MSNLSLYTSTRFPEFVANDKPKIVEFIKSYYKSLESPFYPLDMVTNLLEYYNINNSYFKDLVQSTELISLIDDVITLKTTKGFPDSGFVKINEEVIRYEKRTSTTLENLSRGVGAILKVDNNFIFQTSLEESHSSGDLVYNIAYDFAFYFYTKIKYEILNDFPLSLNENLNLSTLLKTIKSYYLTKGTYLADKLFFKILFNDQVLDIKLKEYGSGASFSFTLDGTGIDSVTVLNGGSGYSNTVDLISSGNGYGASFDVEVINGVISTVNVLNPGANYDINTTFSAVQRSYSLGDTVYGEFDGIGTVVRANQENISVYINKNTFRYNEKIFTDTVENIIESFSSKDILPTKKFPIDNTIKTSDATVETYDYVTVSNVTGEDTLSDISKARVLTYENTEGTFEILSGNVIRVVNALGKVTYNINASNIDKLFPCNITRILKIVDDDIIVDSAAGFPVFSGYFIANGNEYFYNNRSANQFFNISKVGHNEDLSVGDLVQFYAYDFNGEKITNTLDTEEEKYIIEPKFNNTNIVNSGGGFYQDIRFIIKDNRVDELDVFTDNWRINESYNTLDSVNNDNVFCDISGVYDQENDVYVTTSQIPYRPDIDFKDLGAYDQKGIKRIPKRQRVVSENSLNSKGIGIMLDGTQIQSFRGKTISYGKYKSIKITNSGKNYPLVENSGVVTNPALSIEFPNGNYIYLEDQIKVFGSVTSVSILGVDSNDLTGFLSKPTYTITNAVGDSGSGLELDFRLEYTYRDNLVTNIKIVGIIVTNGGLHYTKKPTITIGGGGKLDSFTIPLDSIDIAGELRFLDGTTEKDYSEVDLTSSVLASSTEPSISLNSFERVINPTVEYGSGARLRAIIIEGSISSIVIDDGGQNYIKSPSLIVEGVGNNAVLTPVLSNGVITDVTITNPGSNYSATPTIRVVTDGEGFKTSSQITEWTFNIPEIITTDDYGGFVYDSNIAEHDLSMNKRVLASQQIQPGYLQLSYNHDSTNNTYWNNETDEHSNLIGWAYDGSPIYSSFRAYTYALNDSNLSSSPLTSSYELKAVTDAFRPPTGTYPLGYFVEDYEYVYGSGDLDEYNGRFCVTPEFTEGKYCYFATNTFPYFCGLNLKYTIDPYNKFPYSNIENLCERLLRVHYNDVRYPYQQNNLGNSNVEVESILSGSVEEIFVEVGGDNYSLEDRVIVDNTNTNGGGLSCKISKISGIEVDSFSYNSSTQEVTVTTTDPHLLNTNDKVFITEKTINNTITALTTIDINSSTEILEIVRGINYRFVVDSSFVDSGDDFYTINISRDSLGINTIYNNEYVFNRRDITINSLDLPSIFYIVIYFSDGTIEKSVKVNNNLFDIYGEKTIAVVDASNFKYVINDLSDTYNTLFDIAEYNVTYTSGTYKAPIKEIEILNSGFGYKDTPKLTVNSSSGDGVALNCYGSDIGRIKNVFVNKNTSLCLGYKQDYYETYTYYSGKIKENFELFDVNLESPFILGGANPIVSFVGTGQTVPVTFENDGNYYFDISLDNPISPLDSERGLEVSFQGIGDFNGVQDSFTLVDTDNNQITTPTVTNSLIFRNGVFQSETEYGFDGNEITFISNPPQAGEDIFVYNLNTNNFEILDYSFVDSGSSYYFDVSSNIVDFTNAENRLLVFIEGILQSKFLWTWDNINERIVFNQDYEYITPIIVEIRLLPDEYNFYTTADNTLQTTDTNGYYTYSGIDTDDFTDIIINYNGVVQRYDTQFTRNVSDTLSSVSVDAIEILNDPGTNEEVFVYSLGGDWRYCNLTVSTAFTLFDIIPSYRRLQIPEDRKLYTSDEDEIFILVDKDNGNIVFYSENDISDLLEGETELFTSSGNEFGTLYNVKSANVNVFIDSKTDNKIINQNTKVSDRFSKLSSDYYNPYTIDIKFTRNPSEWKNNYKVLNKPVGIKAYYSRELECYESINKNDRSTSLLTIL